MFFVKKILYNVVAKELLVVQNSMNEEIIGIVHHEGHYGAMKSRELHSGKTPCLNQVQTALI